jgi:hypothetical protein
MRNPATPLLMVDWSAFGSRVGFEMRQRRLSYRAAAAPMQIDFSVLSRIVKGSGCDTEKFLTLCRCFGIDPFDFAKERVDAAPSRKATAIAPARDGNELQPEEARA